MPLRALGILLAMIGLIFGPTVGAMENCAKAPATSCCCEAMAQPASGHGCCTMAPAKPGCGFPVPSDRTAPSAPELEVPPAILTAILRLEPPVNVLPPATAFFAAPEHTPPVLARNCILLI